MERKASTVVTDDDLCELVRQTKESMVTQEMEPMASISLSLEDGQLHGRCVLCSWQAVNPPDLFDL